MGCASLLVLLFGIFSSLLLGGDKGGEGEEGEEEDWQAQEEREEEEHVFKLGKKLTEEVTCPNIFLALSYNWSTNNTFATL